MCRIFGIIILLSATLVAEGRMPQPHRDYVPDGMTAERIAEAVLVGQYGEDRVKSLLPLHVDGSNKESWIVQGWGQGPPTSKGGGPAVWINKHSGCLQVMEYMK